ncbi:hypothetical protein MTO96_021346 [Rhipicephalus appendiculatus]
MEYEVEGESITPAELEADSRWIRAVKAHRAAAAHQPTTSTPPPSTPSQKTTPPPNTTPSATTLRRHAPLPRLPAEDFKIVFRPGGGLDLRTTTNGVLLQTLCSLATIGYATARTADRVRINPYNNLLTVSTPSESRTRLYLRVSELLLGTISYPLRAYMAAPDNALRGIIYNAVDSQTQDEIIQDLQSMDPHTSDPKIAALEAPIAAQQLQIQELTHQLQAALARLFSPAPHPAPSPAPTPTQTPSPPAPAEESMNTAPSAASSRASSPTRRPPHKRRSPSSDAIAPHERDVGRETACFLESFEQRIMTRFTRLEERVAAIDTRVAAIESHLTGLDAWVAALETR